MYSALSGESVDTEPTTHRPSSFVFREQTFFVRMKGGVWETAPFTEANGKGLLVQEFSVYNIARPGLWILGAWFINLPCVDFVCGLT